MAAGTTIKLKRKAGAFTGGELEAGEFGVNTASPSVFFSPNGTTVSSLQPYVGNLQADIAELAFDLAILQNAGTYEMSDGVAITYDDSTGIEAGSSSNYEVDTGTERVLNTATTLDEYAGTLSNTSGFSNYCAIQRLTAAQISASGSQIRLKLGAGPAGTTLDEVWVSQQATSGDVYDSHTDITRVTFNGGSTSPISIPASSFVWSDWITYALDGTKALLVCMDIASGSEFGYNATAGFTVYYKSGSNAAGTTNRSGFTTLGWRYTVMGIESKAGTSGSMVLVSSSYAAASVPTSAAFTIRFVEPGSDVTLNTDLIVYISRDNGTTWSAVTLTELRTVGTTVIASGTVDISGQPSGTSLRSKITTPGGSPKEVEVIAHTLQLR